MWLEQIGDVKTMVFYIFCAVSALNLVLALVNIILGCVIQSPSPGSSMDFYVSIGGLAIVTTVLIRGVNPLWANLTDLEIACQFYPSLLTFGLLWLIGGLLLRCCAIVHFYKTTQGTKTDRRNEWKPNMWMIILMIINAAVVLVWILVFQLEIEDSGDDIYQCTGQQIQYWKLAMSILYGVILLLACVMVWPAIHYSQHQPTSTESNILSVAIYNLLFVTVAGVLLYLFLDVDHNKAYAINGGLLQYAVFFTLLLLMISKIVIARRDQDEGKYLRMDQESNKSGERPSSQPQNYNNTAYDSDSYVNPTDRNSSSGNTFDY